MISVLVPYLSVTKTENMIILTRRTIALSYMHHCWFDVWGATVACACVFARVGGGRVGAYLASRQNFAQYS